MKCDKGMACVMAEQCQYKSSADEAVEKYQRERAAHVELMQKYDAKDIGLPCASEGPESMEAMAKAETILEEAQRLTGNGGDRNDSYDHPYPNFSKIADVWTIVLEAKLKDGEEITPREVALLMIGMKLVRDAHKGKRDNLVDIAGYARCIERLEEWEAEAPESAAN